MASTIVGASAALRGPAASRQGSKAAARAAPVSRSENSTDTSRDSGVVVSNPAAVFSRRSVFGVSVAAAAAALTASGPASATSTRLERRVIDDLALGEREQAYKEITLG